MAVIEGDETTLAPPLPWRAKVALRAQVCDSLPFVSGPSTNDGNVRVVGRYALHSPIAAGGMATVHYGRLLGPVGFSRTVAIKRLHAQFASDPEFVSMFLDEARLAARIRHPNVVPTLDVVATGGELFLVMEYVPGESLARLVRGQAELPPPRIITSVIAGVLHGLHAAHEARDEQGQKLNIVHRDVSPQNILVGTDGVSKILDFGVAKAAGRMQVTRDGQIKGKLAYMPPEQLKGAAVTRTTDIYAAGVILWESLTGERLFHGDNEGVIVAKVLEGDVQPPSKVIFAKRPGLSAADKTMYEAFDKVVLRALASDAEERYPTAREMAIELERVCHPATASDVGEWVEKTAHEVLASRAEKIAQIESIVSSGPFDPSAALSAISSSGPMVPPAHLDESTRAVPPVTQPSSISVATGLPSHAGRKRKLGLVVGVLAGGLVGLVALTAVLTFGNKRDGRVATNPTAAVSSPAAGPTVSTVVPTATATTSVIVAAPAVDAGAPSAKPSGKHQPQPTPTGSHKWPPTPTVTTPPPPPPPNCNPPFYYDKDGVRKYRPECM
jgi:eukaryotic-like serine/threonine-protein kinase